MDDSTLDMVLGTSEDESTLAAAQRLANEVQEWRGACEAAFGMMTANPRASLLALARAQREHHREHHERERVAWETVKSLAVAYGAASSERAANAALALLDEQGMP